MVIQIDSREKKIHRDRITAGFDFLRIKWFVSKLPFGDYMSLDNPKLVVDRKHDLAEVAVNFTQERFLNEMKGAQLYGIKLISIRSRSIVIIYKLIKIISIDVSTKDIRIILSPVFFKPCSIFV